MKAERQNPFRRNRFCHRVESCRTYVMPLLRQASAGVDGNILSKKINLFSEWINMRIMIEEDLPQEKSRPHVPPLNHPGSTNSGPLWPSYRKCKAGQQLWSVSTTHWRVGTLSSPMWKLLSKEICHVNIANICLLTTLSLVSRSVASSRWAIVLTSIWQPIRFNLNRTDTGQRGVEGEGDGRAEGDGEGAQTVLPWGIPSEGVKNEKLRAEGEEKQTILYLEIEVWKLLVGRRYGTSSEFKKCSVIYTTFRFSQEMNIILNFQRFGRF